MRLCRGAWLSDPLNEYLLGRRAAIFVSALFCFISVIGAACVKTYWEMLACRILLGVGMGAKASVGMKIYGLQWIISMEKS